MDRSLAFRDRFTNYLASAISFDTDDDDIDNEVPFGENGTVVLALEVSKEEWRKIFSAVMTGADLKWTDEAHEVTWILWRAAKMGTFCEQVAACISDSAATIAALNTWYAENFTNGSGTPDTPLPPGILSGDILPVGYNCDDDHRFGMANEIVLAIHHATEEVFQAIEVLTNPVELAAEIGDNIPLASLASSALDVASWIQNSAQEAYDLAWSQTTQDNLACELWCKMLEQESCILTFDMIFEIYLDIEEAGSAPPLSGTWVEWIAWLFTLDLEVAALDVVKMCSLLALTVMRWGGSFGNFSLGVRSLETVAQLSADSTDAGHSVLCDCTEWEHEFDFTGSQLDGWTIHAGRGVAGTQGINTVLVPNYPTSPEQSQVANIRISLDTRDITWMNITGKSTIIYPHDRANEIEVWWNSSLTGSYQVDLGSSVPFDLTDTNGHTDVVNIWVYLNGGDTPAPGWIATITLRGSGTDPFI